MTRSSGFERVALNSARWLLPLLPALAVPVTLVYAMSGAIAASTPASTQAEVRSVLSTGEAAEATDLEQSATSLLDTAIDPSGSRSAVMSMTSPASTGHASPNGCCTWN